MSDLQNDYHQIEQILEYHFNDLRLLEQAFTHRSYLNEIASKDRVKLLHNERLEFLGDAVLELVVTDYLFNTYPNFPEGKLTAVRASLVNYRILGNLSSGLGFMNFLRLSRGEQLEINDRSRLPILADCFEAVLGAIYLDGGIQPCAKLIRNALLPLADNIIANETYRDSKSRLQEHHQSLTKSTPHYRIIGEEGKEHDKLFTVAVYVDNIQISTGVGKSKQEAELDAATNALRLLGPANAFDTKPKANNIDLV